MWAPLTDVLRAEADGPDFFPSKCQKTTLDGKNELRFGRVVVLESQNNLQFGNDYPILLLILQLSKTTLYAWMTHGLYLNQINVSVAWNSCSVQLLEWQMMQSRGVSLFFLPPLPTKPLHHKRSTDWKPVVLMADTRSYWLKMWEAWLLPLTPLQTNCMCVWQCVCVSLDEKKIVVNSSCCVFPASDICCCCCVTRLRLGRRIGRKWPIYLFHNCDYLSQPPFLENLKSRKSWPWKPARHCIALKQTPCTLDHLSW